MVKLYVIPVESACNAKCPYCVNQFRNLGNSFLEVGDLEKCLNEIGKLDAIEITGGGEPTLHPKIGEIIDVCANKTRTQMYSNGGRVGLIRKDVLKKLNPLCISRAHYDPVINEQIMGVKYSNDLFSQGLDIKLSAVLFKGGIENARDAEEYIFWAKGKSKKVVFRQLFEDVNYSSDVSKRVVSILPFVDYFFGRSDLTNPSMKINELDVEFETRSCSCENTNPILHADGKINLSWESV